jgi:hypothetical protein
MTKADEAVALFLQGFNCTQSILSVFATDFGLDGNTAARSHLQGVAAWRYCKTPVEKSALPL